MSTKQIILGSILGEGSIKIAKNYKNARFSERHSIVQEDYLKWKVYQLQPELHGTVCYSEPEKTSYNQKAKLIYQSATSAELTLLHHLTHSQNKKRIKRTWLNNLTPLALAVWWCDDGSLNVLTKQGVFCTDSFTYKEHTILARYLEVVWKIKCTIIENPVKNREKAIIRIDYRLRFSNFENLQSFFRLILPWIPVVSMLPKIMICYADPECQQRWISEVKKALPPFSSEISQVYEMPLQKYSHYIKTCKNAVDHPSKGVDLSRYFLSNETFSKALCPRE